MTSTRRDRSPRRRPWRADRARRGDRGTHRRRDVEHEVLVRCIPAGRGVRKEQMPIHQEADEVAGRGLDAHPVEDRRDDTRADRHVPTLPVLADVVQERPEEERIGSDTCPTASACTRSSPAPSPARSRPIARSDPVRWASTVRWWYGSRCGRQRTSAHPGRNAARIPRRSRASSEAAPPSPARSSREKAARTSASHITWSRMPRSSIASSRAADGSRSASASAARASSTAAGVVGGAIGAAPASRSRSVTARNTNSTSRACSNKARISPSIAMSRGSSSNPIARAIEGWRSRTSRSPASRSRGAARSACGRGTPPRPRALRARGRGAVPPPPVGSRPPTRAAGSSGGRANRRHPP